MRLLEVADDGPRIEMEDDVVTGSDSCLCKYDYRLWHAHITSK